MSYFTAWRFGNKFDIREDRFFINKRDALKARKQWAEKHAKLADTTLEEALESTVLNEIVIEDPLAGSENLDST